MNESINMINRNIDFDTSISNQTKNITNATAKDILGEKKRWMQASIIHWAKEALAPGRLWFEGSIIHFPHGNQMFNTKNAIFKKKKAPHQ